MITDSTRWIVEMRTLLLLAVLSCWLSVLLASGLRAEDLREAGEEYGDDDDAEAEEKMVEDDYDSDITERNLLFEQIPSNSFSYVHNPDGWNKLPRFAVISGKTFQLNK